MKFLSKNIINQALKKSYFYLLFLFVVFIYFLINLKVIPFLDINFFKCVLGVGKYESGLYINNLILLSIYVIIIYYTVYLYLTSTFYNIQNVLLRIKKSKFVLINNLVITFIIIMLSVFPFLISIIFKLLFDLDFNLLNYISFYKYSLLIYLLISQITIFMINLTTRSKYMYILILFNIYIIYKTVVVDITTMNSYILLLANIILYIINIIIYNPIKIYNKYH